LRGFAAELPLKNEREAVDQIHASHGYASANSDWGSQIAGPAFAKAMAGKSPEWLILAVAISGDDRETEFMLNSGTLNPSIAILETVTS